VSNKDINYRKVDKNTKKIKNITLMMKILKFHTPNIWMQPDRSNHTTKIESKMILYIFLVNFTKSWSDELG